MSAELIHTQFADGELSFDPLVRGEWSLAMRRAVARTVLIAAVGLGSQLALAAAEGPPNLNAEPSCKAAADSAAMGSIGGGNVRDLASCMRDENEARDQLAKEWAQFSPSDQQRCTSETKTGGSPSYVELLVCLEMIRDAKNPSGQSETSPSSSRGQRRR
jgi:hypothetical protein